MLHGVDSQLPTFRANIWLIPRGFPETPATSYQSTTRNIQEKQRSHLHRVGRLQSRLHLLCQWPEQLGLEDISDKIWSKTNLLIFLFKTLQRHVSALRSHLQAEHKRLYIYIYYCFLFSLKMAAKSRNFSL